MKHLNMTLLNSEELAEIQGGAGQPYSCTKSGDTILCNRIGKIKACLTFEVSCLPKFSSSCNEGSFSITCCSSVSFR